MTCVDVHKQGARGNQRPAMRTKSGFFSSSASRFRIRSSSYRFITWRSPVKRPPGQIWWCIRCMHLQAACQLFLLAVLERNLDDFKFPQVGVSSRSNTQYTGLASSQRPEIQAVGRVIAVLW